jgi:hypothetical protein
MVGTVLDTVIGLSFVFAVTALMVTASVEGVATMTKKRAKWLLRGIQQLFGETTTPPPEKEGLDKLRRDDVVSERITYGRAVNDESAQLWAQVMAHPLLAPLRRRDAKGGSTQLPVDVPADVFARALIDLLTDDDGKGRPSDIKLDTLPAQLTQVKKALQAIIKTLPEDDAAGLRKAIEDWYNAQMKAVGEAYRRWAKRWAIAIGAVVAICLNVSTIGVAHALYVDGPLRETTVAAATSGELCSENDTQAEIKSCVETHLNDLADAGLPIGWSGFDPQGLDYLLFPLGWILTGLAASFGAPFWFDALKRLSGAKKTLEGT